MQLFQIYWEDPEKRLISLKKVRVQIGIYLYKKYMKTGVTFDFSEERIESTASVILDLIND